MAKKNHYEWKEGKPLPPIGPHSLAKHRILRRYIERYLEIVTANSRQRELRITLVDGYAGGGRYTMGRELIVGSPFIFLEAVAAVEQRLNASRKKGFSIKVDYIFVDQNKNHTDFLRAEIEKSCFADKLDKSVHIWTADFNTRVDDIIAKVRARSPQRGRSIFLLDQYGWSQVAFGSIRKILTGLPKAEVFLTFSVDALINYLSESSFDLKAFGEIDVDPGFVRELVREKEDNQSGYRAVIQNGLYSHIQSVTGAAFYSPFFIKSPDANRSYWFLHLSSHREARNEIGMIHWDENNTTVHHGGAGLHSLGFSTGKDIDQMVMGYVFDDHSKTLSRDRLRSQLPEIIFDATKEQGPQTLENLFGMRCNDTPVVRHMLEECLVELRTEGEILIVDEHGKDKPRAKTVDWTDRIILAPQPSFFGSFAKLQK